jgi:hypothetical protein
VPDELDLLRDLGRDVADPDSESVDRARGLLEQRIARENSVGATREPKSARRSRRLRWTAAVAAVSVLVGSAVGFAVASVVASTGSASSNLVGFGFLPARGWNVSQTGALDGGTPSAVAANVPLNARDQDGEPFATLRSLPPRGVLIWTRFTPRGDAASDRAFPVRTLPLQLGDGDPVSPLRDRAAPAGVFRYRIATAIGGYNVDARVYFGSRPSPDARAEVQQQLDRLVVAASGVTLVVQPRVVRDVGQRMTVFGSVASGKAGEKVIVQFKACGASPSPFRDFLETTTRAGGGFSFLELQPFGPGISGVFRAVSGDATSPDLPITHLADVSLQYPRGGRTTVRVSARVSLWRRHALLQRYDRPRGTWVTIRRVTLTEQGGGPSPYPGPAPTVFYTEPFRPGVARGTLIRAVMPLSQARPCYLAGVSEVRRA